MWSPRTIAKLVNMTPTTMVYECLWYSKHLMTSQKTIVLWFRNVYDTVSMIHFWYLITVDFLGRIFTTFHLSSQVASSPRNRLIGFIVARIFEGKLLRSKIRAWDIYPWIFVVSMCWIYGVDIWCIDMVLMLWFSSWIILGWNIDVPTKLGIDFTSPVITSHQPYLLEIWYIPLFELGDVNHLGHRNQPLKMVFRFHIHSLSHPSI